MRIADCGMRICSGAALFVVVAIARAAPTLAAPTSQHSVGKEVSKESSRGPVKVGVKLDRDEVQIPETLALTITVESEKGVEVSWPRIGETFGDFGVKAAADEPSSEDATSERRGKTYTLEAFLPETATIPALKIAFADRREKADGSKEPYEDAVEIESLKITVRGGLADVKGPVGLPWPWSYVLIAWTIGLLLAVVAIALLARWWLRKRAAQAAAPPRPVAAHDWALAELDMLASEGLIERGKVREFYYRINAILRGYIERRWGLMAGEQTSEEFIRELQRSMFLDDPHKQVLRRFVDACDPVKYAREEPGGDDITWVQTTARAFILETAQRAVEPQTQREAA